MTVILSGGGTPPESKDLAAITIERLLALDACDIFLDI
jgi:hypothetical protein